eukprot:TRINITY_DN12105_c0_g1_i1.p1 TRINITY_DN12105_c0_g1~~TRINITY_DN12105_c0_g1_i1.p1  ORF type:complete len:145 (+),score=13.83 TRINITY_DN12105_c0_g1_i1:367-801(+)
MSYNLHFGIGMDGKCDPVRQARVINSVDPDIVTLQEIDINSTRCPMNLLEKIKENTAHQYSVFYKARDLPDGGFFGNGVLSKHKILEVKEYNYTPWQGRQTRSAVAVRIHPPQLEKVPHMQLILFGSFRHIYNMMLREESNSVK